MLKLIVFLGNPSPSYRKTRHNAGQMVCERIAEKGILSGSWQTKFHAQFCKTPQAVLLKPQVFMNESGISVREASDFFGIAPADILVVHDDIELPFGEVRVRTGGGMGGHNGLRSVKQHLGTENFGRLRIGVGRPPSGIQVADFVLGRFSDIEEKQLPGILEKAVAAALEYIAG